MVFGRKESVQIFGGSSIETRATVQFRGFHGIMAGKCSFGNADRLATTGRTFQIESAGVAVA